MKLPLKRFQRPPSQNAPLGHTKSEISFSKASGHTKTGILDSTNPPPPNPLDDFATFHKGESVTYVSRLAQIEIQIADTD